MKHSVVRWLIMFVLVGIVAGCGVTENTDTYNGSTVPWSELLGTAQAEAQKVDPQAVLTHVEASLPNPTKNAGVKTIIVNFWFRQADGHAFFVTLDDTNPTTTAHVTQRDIDVMKPLTMAEQQTVVENQQQILLSPSNVMTETWMEGMPKNVVRTRIGLSLDLNPSLIKGVATSQPIWSVSYIGLNDTVTLYVDAATGEIIKRESGEIRD